MFCLSLDSFTSLNLEIRGNAKVSAFPRFEYYHLHSNIMLVYLKPCVPSATVAGDGEDNDCDGMIDEETDNGIDDDGDGSIDEDLAIAPRGIVGNKNIALLSLCIESMTICSGSQLTSCHTLFPFLSRRYIRS